MKKLYREKRNRGQTLVEYALILAFISVITISVLAALGRQITGTFSRVTSAIVSGEGSH
jgi:Flp pilus assembly pilin Flp